MTRLFYHTNNHLYFDHQAFVKWATEMGLYDPEKFEDIKIEWIDRSGLLHIN